MTVRASTRVALVVVLRQLRDVEEALQLQLLLHLVELTSNLLALDKRGAGDRTAVGVLHGRFGTRRLSALWAVGGGLAVLECGQRGTATRCRAGVL